MFWRGGEQGEKPKGNQDRGSGAHVSTREKGEEGLLQHQASGAARVGEGRRDEEGPLCHQLRFAVARALGVVVD